MHPLVWIESLDIVARHRNRLADGNPLDRSGFGIGPLPFHYLGLLDVAALRATTHQPIIWARTKIHSKLVGNLLTVDVPGDVDNEGPSYQQHKFNNADDQLVFEICLNREENVCPEESHDAQRNAKCLASRSGKLISGEAGSLYIACRQDTWATESHDTFVL